MTPIGTWIAALAWPMVSRVLSALGIGTITYIGLSAALNSALSAAKSAVGGLSGDVMSLLAMAGMFQAMSIIAGGLISGLVFIATKKFTL